jgi:hypothetical protein
MSYWDFIKLSSEEKEEETFSNGDNIGQGVDGNDVYSLYDFWVVVRENKRAFLTFQATTQEPDL